MSKNITYNSFDLQDTNWHTQDIIYRNLPDKILDIEPLARDDGFRLVNTYYNKKEIKISGTVSSDTEANLKTLVDNMKKALNVDEANLDIDDGNTVIRWIASVSNIQIPEQHYHITEIPYQITFVCQPFSHSTSSSTDTDSFTTSTASGSIVIVGNTRPKPVIQWTVSGTPSAAITGITFVNSTTNDTITLTGLELDEDGEYVEVDTDNKTVVTNTGSGDTTIDFTGVFPTFASSTNSYSITITGGGGSKTLLQQIVYYPAYL